MEIGQNPFQVPMDFYQKRYEQESLVYYKQRREQIEQMSTLFLEHQQQLQEEFQAYQGINIEHTVTFYGPDLFDASNESLPVEMPQTTSFREEEEDAEVSVKQGVRIPCKTDGNLTPATISRIVLAKIRHKMTANNGELLANFYQFYHMGGQPDLSSGAVSYSHFEETAGKVTTISHNYLQGSDGNVNTSWLLTEHGKKFTFRIVKGEEMWASKTWTCFEKAAMPESKLNKLKGKSNLVEEAGKKIKQSSIQVFAKQSKLVGAKSTSTLQPHIAMPQTNPKQFHSEWAAELANIEEEKSFKKT